MRTIETTIAQIEAQLEAQHKREEKARAEVKAIIERGESEGRSHMTLDEKDEIKVLFERAENAKVEQASLKEKLATAKRVAAEEAESDRLASIIVPTGVKPPVSNGEYRVSEDKRSATSLYGVSVQADTNLWRRSNDGMVASLSREQRFADHAVVKREAEKTAERDRILIGTHGDFAGQIRAMTTSGASAVVPTLWSNEIIDRARNAAVVMQAGATVVPMASKVEQIGRLTADPAPAFKTEGNPVSASDLTYDYVQLTATTLTAIVVVSNEFLQDGVNASESIQNSLAHAMALEIDKAALFGQLGATGTNDEGSAYGLASPYPKGLLKALVDYNSGSQIVGAFPTNGTAQTAATPWAELLSVVYKPLRSNEKCTAIVSNVALEQQYETMMDSTYQPLRKPEVIAGMPWLKTNAIPSFTRGSMTSRATDVFAGDWSQLLIGQRLGLEIRVLTERYAENYQTAILASWRGDVQLARPTAFDAYRALQGAA